MAKAPSKWFRIGQVKEAGGKNGKPTFEVMELDNENLKEFVRLLKEFGQNKIGSMTVDEIRTAQKLKFDDPNQLKRIKISRFNKTEEDYEKVPRFILADLLINLDDFT
jgi:hypothetical protein